MSGPIPGLDAAPLRPFETVDGYPPLEDLALIGDGTSAALVARNGEVVWLCLPRFDSPPVFCSLLDATRGGSFRVAPRNLIASRHRYLDDTGVVVTDLRSDGGLVRLTDCLALRAGADLTEDTAAARGELVRLVEVLEGTVDLEVVLEPRGGSRFAGRTHGFDIAAHRRPDLQLQLVSSFELDGPRSSLRLSAGQGGHLVLRWHAGRRHAELDAHDLVAATVATWRRWLGELRYDGPSGPLVRRSALTLKMLDYFATGAVVAAPTSSLPEAVGGVRNWDYRFAWVRDAAFAVYAFHRVGLAAEARGFLGWVLDAIERDAGVPRVLYDVDGARPQPEWIDPELEGYRRSAPVRWGNAAVEQRQHDVYGEIVDCAFQWVTHGGELSEELWGHLARLIDDAASTWHVPDHGIWEVRCAGRPFTYSAAMCHVALDRGAQLAERRPGWDRHAARWRKEAARVYDAILGESWDPEVGSLTEHLGGGGVDAALLALPLRRVIDAAHPKMTATVGAVAERLGAGGGLLYRYRTQDNPDGLPGEEGAFVLCSFWWADNLAYQGRLDEAVELFESLCARVSDLGLLPEQIDPTTGAFLGNFPQAFSHVGLVSSAFNLERTRQRLRSRG